MDPVPVTATPPATAGTTRCDSNRSELTTWCTAPVLDAIETGRYKELLHNGIL